MAEFAIPGRTARLDGARAIRRAEWLRYAALAAILLVAFTLRLLWPDVAEFKIDEVQLPALADRIWVEHRLAATWGVSSTGLPETPFIGYLLVLPRILTADPRAAVAFMGLLDGLAVLLIYVAAKRFAGERLALVTAALYAAAPWAVVFSRKTWAEIVPLFTVLILWAAYEVVVRRRPAWALVFFPFLALQVQAHVMGMLFLAPMILTLLLFWRRWLNRYTPLGVLLGLLILLPYGLALAGQWGATKAVLQQNTGQGTIVDLQALEFGLWFASGRTLTALLGRSAPVLSGWEEVLKVVNVVTAALLAWALGAAIWATVRRRQGWERQALLLIWVLAPLVPLVFVRGALGIHYLLIVSPAVFILLGIGWAQLLGLRQRLLALAALLALVAVLAVQAGTVLAVYDGVTRYPTDGGFGWPLRRWLEIQQDVRTHIALEGWPELQVLGINDAPWSSERNIVDYLFGRTVRRRTVGQGGRPGILLPEKDDALALVMAADDEMRQLLERFGQEEEHWPIPGNEWGVRLYRLRAVGEAGLAGDINLAGPASFANGMRLLGAWVPRVVHPGESLHVRTYWRYTGRVITPGTTDMAFNHLKDGADRTWGQNDGFALSQSQWREGVILLQWFDIALPADLPPGEYWLFTGMYSWQDMSRANVVDENGNPVSDSVKLGPIRVTAGK